MISQGACKGDSGGPLMLSEDGSYTQIGIVQGAVAGCGNTIFHGIYVRIDHPIIFNFIQKGNFLSFLSMFSNLIIQT